MKGVVFECEITPPPTPLEAANKKIERLRGDIMELERKLTRAKELLKYDDLRKDINNLYYRLMDMRI